MTDKLKLGFLGGGLNSAVGNVHKIALQMDSRFELVTGYFSRDSRINQKTAEQYGIDAPSTSRDSLINEAKTNLDAVVILTPTPNHKQDVIDCLEAGIPVICEKALANSSEEAKVIASVQAAHKGFLAVTFNYTGYPMIRELKNLIHQGLFGDIEQVHIEMPQEGFSRLDKDGNPIIPQAWRLHDGNIPTICLDLGVHIHHMIHFLTGEKTLEVVALQNSFGSFSQIVDNVSCIAKYSNGLQSNIWFSKVALGQRNGLKVRIYGTKGAAEWYQMAPEELLTYDNAGRRSIIDRAGIDVAISNQLRYNRFKAGHPTGFIEAFANHYHDIADALIDHKSKGKQIDHDFVFGVEAATQGLHFLEALTESSSNHCWVSINVC